MIPERKDSDRVWGRANDNLIAEKCEGWKLVLEGLGRGLWLVPGPEEMHEMDSPEYSTDITATIRAAEAWRKQAPGRYWEHGVTDDGVEFARLGTGFGEWETFFGPAALAWALWEACQ